MNSQWIRESPVYVRLGRIEEIKNIISNIEEIAGNLKLVGEHADAEKKEFTGNFPQVFVHAEIINLIKEIVGNKSKVT
ncbi:putative glycosylhydrolase [Saccharolobus shibatae B12]|uniref:Glycosylhydrolase n=1 Tax=Saccharolobus shibatae (strain ATCC 51178 / DSM 5389 / JCM 8931 / NBRC 15437 / B12) TaxID=523848 RepID=A0A8F5BP72_SACSH|nr:hypothetical protein [Saccharolobus shibatae]QXJ28881.1 putative glycosylhydrolase [Saccharolobus shibatae B12]